MTGLESSTAQPLLLIGARRRAVLHHALIGCIDSWRLPWSATRDPVRLLSAQEAGHPSVRSSHSTGLTIASAKHGNLASVYADLEALPTLLGVTTHAELGASDPHGLAREFLVEVLSSLCAELAKHARVDDAVIEAARGTEPPNLRARFFPATVQVGSAKPRVALFLTARCVELLAPPQVANHMSPAVTRRRQAVASESVQVAAVLGEAEVSLRELMQLTTGDVIVLDQPLRAGGRLTMQDGTTVARVLLGRAGDRRAVSISKRI